MNNTINNTTVGLVDAIIQESYEVYIDNLISICCLALLSYAALLKFTQEVEHIWNKRFTLPTLLYILTRYGSIIQQALDFALNFVPLGRPCNILTNASNSMSFLAYAGVQGLLVARAYAMCQGGKIATIALSFGLFPGLILELFGIIAFPGCLTTFSTKDIKITLANNIIVVYTDALIFGIIIWKVWGTWKFKHEIGIQGSGHNLVSVLVTQGIARFCFVVFITVTGTVLATAVPVENFPASVIIQGFTFFQNALSSILVADFTLELRRVNSDRIETHIASLPTLQLTNVLQHVNQSIRVELASFEDINVTMTDIEIGDHDSVESIPAMDSATSSNLTGLKIGLKGW